MLPETCTPLLTILRADVFPKLLVMMDQFGVLHAPMAQARAYLHENKLNDCPILLHDAKVWILLGNTWAYGSPVCPRASWSL